MPILFPDFQSDVAALTEIATGVADYWNEFGADDYGFYVFTTIDSIKEISREGDIILASFFPEDPGAFKRIATLLVLARLKPLFHLGTLKSTEKNCFPISDTIVQEWLPRICFLLVEPMLDRLSVFCEKSNRNIPLTEWQDFPSVHSKAEFLLWLDWLRDYNPQQLTADFENLVRRGRMILSTALILEAVYYQNNPTFNMIGICDHKLDLTCATYDAQLWYKAKNRQK